MWGRLSQGVRDGLIVAAVPAVVAILWAFVPGKTIPEQLAWIWSCVTIGWEAVSEWMVAKVEWPRWIIITTLLAFLAVLIGTFGLAKRLEAKKFHVFESRIISPFDLAKKHSLLDKKSTDEIGAEERKKYSLRLQILGVFWGLNDGQHVSVVKIASVLGRNENLVRHDLELLVAEGLVVESVDQVSGNLYQLSREGRAFCAPMNCSDLERSVVSIQKNKPFNEYGVGFKELSIISALCGDEGEVSIDGVMQSHNLTPAQAKEMISALRDKGFVSVVAAGKGLRPRYTLTGEGRALLQAYPAN